jgi:hypothetical protein
VTNESFTDELRHIRDQFDWKLQADGESTFARRVLPRFVIRASCKSGSAAGKIFEPIAAVCYALNGTEYEENTQLSADKELGLSSVCIAEIVAASNDSVWVGAEGKRGSVEYLQGLTARLLDVVGLEF